MLNDVRQQTLCCEEAESRRGQTLANTMEKALRGEFGKLDFFYDICWYRAPFDRMRGEESPRMGKGELP